jgi:hypothetical protein
VGLAHGLGLVPESVARRARFCLKAALVSLTGRRGCLAHLPQAAVLGRSVPVIGRVSMDQCCLDVTDVPEADRGTAVILPARRICASPAIPRVYTGQSE